MKVIRHSDADFPRKLGEVTAPSSLFDPSIEHRTRAILNDVHVRGDAALLELTEKFDGAKLAVGRLTVTQAELFNASLAADESLCRRGRSRKERRRFRQKITAQKLADEKFARRDRRRKIRSVPAGRGLHSGRHGAARFDRADDHHAGKGGGLPGNRRLHALRPGRLHQSRAVVRDAGGGGDGDLSRRRRASHCGHGLRHQDDPPRAKIFGPGNAYVVTAKRLLVGHVAIDLLPGPSELLVLADETANPKFAAADLLAQAEHGSGHERVWLVTTSGKIIKAVGQEITRQMPKQARREFIKRVLDNNVWLIQVKTLDDGVALANRLAPEHCEVMTRNPRKLSEKILTAGAIFLGPWSPTVLGDYVAGPSHTLPTGGAGASFAGLTVDQFQRRTSVVEYTRASLKKALPAVKKFAEIEGLDAHGKSAEIRK